MKEENKTDDNAELNKLLDKHFKEAKRFRDNFEEEWRECEDFYEGKHWKDKKKSYKNLVFPLVEQEIAILTDSLPSTDILARRDSQEDGAKYLEASIHFTYEQQNLFLKLGHALRSALKTGTGFHYVDYDPELDSGHGLTTIKTLSWEHVYFDPAATDIDEAAFVGIKFPIRIEEAKRRYPKYKEKIKEKKSSNGLFASLSAGLKEDRHNYSQGSASTEDRFKLDGMTEIEEAWLRDYSMIEILDEETSEEIEKETEQFFNGEIPDIGRYEDHLKHNDAHRGQLLTITAQALGITPDQVTDEDIESLKQDPDLGIIILLLEDHMKIHEEYYKTNPENKRPKFTDSLRLVIRIGECIVYDGEPPVNDGMVPVVPYYCYKDDKSIWGTGEIKNILPSQKSFNEMDNAEYESLHLTSNPGWVMEADCGIEPSSISNKRGKVYVVKKGAQFKRLEPGQTSPQLTSRKMADQQFMEVITGMNEASQGRRPGGITAAKAIERLQQQTNGRIRLKTSLLALYSLPRLGRLVASRNAKYWTTERFMRVTDSATGEVKLVQYSPDEVRDLEYDVRVTQGSLAGTDKEAQAEVMAAYVDKGWIPPKVYFQIIDVPNKKKVLEALEENDQQRAMLEQTLAENEQLKAMLEQINANMSQAPEQMLPQMPEQEQVGVING